MQHFLASQRLVDVPIRHLFLEYRYWIERTRPFRTVADKLATLSNHGDAFRRFIAPQKGDTVFDLATFLSAFEISTVYPLLLSLSESPMKPAEWCDITAVLESYLVRRAVMGWSTKSYFRNFLSLAKHLREVGTTRSALEVYLSKLQGESAAWPGDAEFQQTWLTAPANERLSAAKLGYVLKRLNATDAAPRGEAITIDSPLTIEHIMPVHWQEHWPLPGSHRGLTDDELGDPATDDVIAAATRHRNAAVQTVGNLTILTQGLNSAMSNAAWGLKKPAMMEVSLLPINQRLHKYKRWDEEAIQKRGKELFAAALKLWPGPR